MKTKTKKEIAQEYAKRNGITGYKVKGNRMIYYKNYIAYPTEEKYTMKITVRLDTLKEERQKLKKLYPKGEVEVRR